ncbi:hypothetical protein BDR26DRAFT_874074 [Obelidium mucronatum]|nr:hypothetical protein BDR26DRAFT_874074 [Obelidium mucronatum]
MSTRQMLPLPAATALENQAESKPAQRLSPASPRPSPAKPHGLKSTFKDLFKGNSKPDVNVVSYAQKKGPIPEPIKTAVKSYKPGTDSSEKFWFDLNDFVDVTPTDSLPPSVSLSSTVSRRYKKHLSRKYTYSSVFTKGGTIGRKYAEPDLDNFSYSEASYAIPSAADDANSDLDTDLYSQRDADSSYYDYDEDDDKDFIAEGNLYIEAIRSHSLAQTVHDTESIHTIHNMHMLPLVAPERSTGHTTLLETYSDIIGEISDLVPEDQLAAKAPLANPGVSGQESEEQQQQQRLLRNPPSSYSILNAYSAEDDREDDDDHHEIIVEEYFIEHWVRAQSDSEISSSGSPTPLGSTTPVPGGLDDETSAASSVPSLVHEGTADLVSITPSTSGQDFESLAGSIVESLSAEDDSENVLSGDESSQDNLSGQQKPEHLIVSKVTRVVTLSRNNIVQNVEVKVEPLGKVQPSAEKRLARASQLNLRGIAERQRQELLNDENSQKLAEKGESVGALAVTPDGKQKRRSGLSQFLHFLANH